MSPFLKIKYSFRLVTAVIAATAIVTTTTAVVKAEAIAAAAAQQHENNYNPDTAVIAKAHKLTLLFDSLQSMFYLFCLAII